MEGRRAALLGTVVVLGLSSAAALAGQGNSGRGPTPGFATPVVTDPFHPGFEPDVAIDKSAAHRGRAYVTWPNGFSTTVSYILRSDDGLRTFHPIEATTLAGKPLSCPGGGDTDMQVNRHDGEIFFADLQGLTNFSNAVSKDGGRTLSISCTAVPGAGVDRQWIALDTNGGTASVGTGQGAGRAYFTYDNVAADAGSNQLVVNQSSDGYTYGGSGNCAAPGVNCVVPPAVVSVDEGIPGNMLVDDTLTSQYRHTIYVPHSTGKNDGVRVDFCRGASTTPRLASAIGAACTDPTNFSPADSHHVNPLWHDVLVHHSSGTTLAGFATLSIDTAGNLYTAWAEYPVNGNGPNGAGAVYIATSKNGGLAWSQPIRVSTLTTPTVVFPWIASGDPGRINVVYYGAPQESYHHLYGPNTLDNGTWNVYLAQSLDALSASPHFTTAKASDHQVKYGNISTAGLGGSPDRSLGDYLQVQTGVNGEAVVSYVDDTSANRNADICAGCGQTPAEAAGPTMIVRQTQGASLYTKVGTLRFPVRRPFGSTTDTAGDAFVALNGNDVKAPPGLDILKASVDQADTSHLRFTMTTADPNLAHDLQVSAALGGLTGDWIIRWAAPQYHHAGDGNIFYVGMESTNGGAPAFYTGTTTSLDTTHTKFFIYGHNTSIPGSIKGATITWTVPLSAVDNPRPGNGLYSITGFTSVQTGPTIVGPLLPINGTLSPYSPPNLVDATPAFGYRIARRASAAGAVFLLPLGLLAGLSAMWHTTRQRP